MKDKFIQFLKDNNAYEAYVAELSNPSTGEYVSVDHFLSYTDPEDYISLTFLWQNSERDYGYWYDLSLRWFDIIHQ